MRELVSTRHVLISDALYLGRLKVSYLLRSFNFRESSSSLYMSLSKDFYGYAVSQGRPCQRMRSSLQSIGLVCTSSTNRSTYCWSVRSLRLHTAPAAGTGMRE